MADCRRDAHLFLEKVGTLAFLRPLLLLVSLSFSMRQAGAACMHACMHLVYSFLGLVLLFALASRFFLPAAACTCTAFNSRLPLTVALPPHKRQAASQLSIRPLSRARLAKPRRKTPSWALAREATG